MWHRVGASGDKRDVKYYNLPKKVSTSKLRPPCHQTTSRTVTAFLQTCFPIKTLLIPQKVGCETLWFALYSVLTLPAPDTWCPTLPYGNSRWVLTIIDRHGGFLCQQPCCKQRPCEILWTDRRQRRVLARISMTGAAERTRDCLGTLSLCSCHLTSRTCGVSQSVRCHAGLGLSAWS